MTQSQPQQQQQRVRVGVVGGGAAGVIAAKTLRAAGHDVVLFEKGAQLGGVWKYERAIHTDASMYESLRTNLPTAVMQLDDFPFPSGRPSFVSHRDVLTYIQDYAAHFHVTDVARLNATVVGISKETGEGDDGPAWHIDVDAGAHGGTYYERVDKVLICNGHFATPAVATVPGLEHFHGETLHSHDYRTPAPFTGKRVLLLGCGPSGQDISLELAKPGAAAHVTVAFKEVDDVPASPVGVERRSLKPPIERILPDGSIVFTDGTTQPAPDVLMFCTGYLYIVKHVAPTGLLYPELPLPTDELDPETRDALAHATAASAVIAPLYKQLFSIEEPDVAFVGLPFKNLPFLCFELQAKWAASVFHGGETGAALPSKQRMYASFFNELRALPFPVRKLHQLGVERQEQYFAELASLAGTKVSRVVQEMFVDAGFLRRTYPFHYRDAQFTRDPTQDGKWVRRLTLSGPDGSTTDKQQVLVHTFDE